MTEINNPPGDRMVSCDGDANGLDWDSDQPFRILSLDGGGIRGIFLRQYSRTWKARTLAVIRWPNTSI